MKRMIYKGTSPYSFKAGEWGLVIYIQIDGVSNSIHRLSLYTYYRYKQL